MFYKLNLFKKLIIDKYPIFSKLFDINHGLDHEREEEDAEDKDHIMGATNEINWKVIKENGDWTGEAKNMIEEVQRGRYFDTMNCTRFGLNNVKEFIHLAKWGERVNYSDRFPGKLQGTTTRGNSMKRQLENDRKYGCVAESDFPFDKDKFKWNDYYSMPSSEILDKGQQWLKKYTFGYDKVWATKAMIKEALKYSPLYVGGYAWARKGNVYVSLGNPNHCFTVIKHDKMVAYDSYVPYVKNLDDNYKLYYVYRIYLEKREPEINKSEVDKLLKRGAKLIMRVESNGQIHRLTDKLEHVDSKEFLTDRASKRI